MEIVSDIVKNLERLKDFPESGARCEDNEGNLLCRYVKEGNYYSFYKNNKSTIAVYRILYAKRDFRRILG